MTTRPITFGAIVPQGWKTELVAIEGAEAKWAKAVEVPRPAEALGYDSLWVYDHFHNVPRPATRRCSSAGPRWPRSASDHPGCGLGQMVGCAHLPATPGCWPKITSNIDVMQRRPLDWGIGAGWYDHEFRGYGYEFLPAKGPHPGAARDRRDRALDVDPADTSYERQVLHRRRRPSATPSPLQTRTRRSSSGAAASS
jgi:hypothetical protein